jgi:DNA replication initiation complex subunit (GINS family)
MDERYGGHTWLWRSCCLDKVAEGFQMKGEKGSKVTVTKYNWCMTRDVSNITITGKKRSMIRRGGLIHSQFYGMNKLQFDALKQFPWGDRDDTMMMMALDKVFREAMRATVGAKATDMNLCRRSYNHSGRRFLMGTRLNQDQSWGAREEHRMNLVLLEAIKSELQSRGNPVLRPREDRFQFFVHPTSLVNEFSEYVALPIASWFQQTLGMAPEGMLGIDHQKLAILQSLLLKHSYGSPLLCKHPFLWEKRVRREGEEEGHKIGLGLKDVIRKYGFAWLPNYMFDWEANTFAAGIADQFPFPIRQLEKRYERRKGERDVMRDILQEMDQIIGRIKTLRDSDQDHRKRRILLRWITTRVMRQYHQDVWDGLYKSPYEFEEKRLERLRQEREEITSEIDSEDEESRPKKKRRVTKKNAKVVMKTWEEPPALTYAAVKKELGEDPLPVGLPKSYFNREDLFKLIFQPDDDIMKNGQGWKSKPYLHALKMLQIHLNTDDYRFMMRRLEHLFNKTCHCVPNISADRWLVNIAQSKSRPGWIAFDENGDRLDCSSFKAWRALEEGSSWLETRSIHDDKYWNVTLEEILDME